jgi:hypothetical protein
VSPHVRLAHAAAMRPLLTSSKEWCEITRLALDEHDKARARIAELERQIKSMGPKFQGMVELA